MTAKTFTKWLGILGFVGLSLGSATTQEERLSAMQNNCANRYGYQYGTSEMAQCVERQSYQNKRDAEKFQHCLSLAANSTLYNRCILAL